MTFARLLLQLLLLLAAASVLPGMGESAEGKKLATFKDVTISASDSHLLFYATLDNGFTPEMKDVLHSGIPLKFSFFIELYKTTANWPDEQLTVLTFQHILVYDTLKEIYRITLDEENHSTVTIKTLEEAIRVVGELNGTKIVPFTQLLPDHRYKLKLRAELFQKTLPLSLHNVLPFLSWGDVATDWHMLEFSYR
jgi:hypothetical protein